MFPFWRGRGCARGPCCWRRDMLCRAHSGRSVPCGQTWQRPAGEEAATSGSCPFPTERDADERALNFSEVVLPGSRLTGATLGGVPSLHRPGVPDRILALAEDVPPPKADRSLRLVRSLSLSRESGGRWRLGGGVGRVQPPGSERWGPRREYSEGTKNQAEPELQQRGAKSPPQPAPALVPVLSEV